MKKIYTILIVIAIASLPALAVDTIGASVDRDTLIKWQKGIVKCNYHSLAVTTGFIINDSPCIVATAFHLIQDDIDFVDGYHIYVKTYDGKVLQAKVLYFERKSDLLLLQIDYIPEFWFQEYENPKHGQPCVALGLPYDWSVALEAKIITNRSFEVVGIDRVMVPGSSGSVVVSEEGKILGMAVAVWGYTRITPGIIIKNALGQVMRDG